MKQIYEYVKNQLSPKRYAHTCGCMEAARMLAVRYGVDQEQAEFCAVLHDVTKEYSVEKQLKICVQWDIMLDDITEREPALLHAVTGAYTAKHLFGASEEGFNAIRYHTTGRENMTLLDKIICLADYIEPNRDFPGVDVLRKKSLASLEEALVFAFANTICFTVEKGHLLHPDTVLARNALIRNFNGQVPERRI